MVVGQPPPVRYMRSTQPASGCITGSQTHYQRSSPAEFGGMAVESTGCRKARCADCLSTRFCPVVLPLASPLVFPLGSVSRPATRLRKADRARGEVGIKLTRYNERIVTDHKQVAQSCRETPVRLRIQPFYQNQSGRLVHASSSSSRALKSWGKAWGLSGR